MSYIPDDIYKTILENIAIPCVDICIVHKGAILLVKRIDMPAKGQWWVPGGRVYKGEFLKDAAKRKVKEEVGIDCLIGPIIHNAETIFQDGPYGTSVHSVNSCFFAYPTDPNLGLECSVLDSHHSEYKWVTSIDPRLHTYVQDCLKGAGLVHG